MREYGIYFQKILCAIQGDEMEKWEGRYYLEDRAVGN